MDNFLTEIGLSGPKHKSSIFEKVWDSSADGMRITDPEGIMLYVNEAFCKMVDKDKGLLIGQPLQIIYRKDTQEDVSRQYKENHFSQKLQLRTEREIELWNGEIIDVELSNSFIILEDNKRVVLSIFRDITERNKMAEDLYESRQMLQLVLDNIPQRVFWKDTNSVYLGCNKHFAEDAGLKDPHEIISMNDFEVSWKETANLYRADDKLVMETDTAKINYEEPQTRPDGELHYLRTSKVPLHDKAGRVIGILGSYEDITEKKRAEEKLRMLSCAVEQSRSSYVITDTECRIEYVNPAFTEIKGYSSEEVIGDTPRILTTGATTEEIYNELWNTIKSGGEWRGELQNIKKGGELYWEFVIVSPIKNEEGVIEHFLIVQEDITEKKIKDDQLRKAVKEKEVMLSEIHHRVKNNLQIISSLLKLQSGYIKDPAAHEYFQISQDRVKTMALIHEQLYKSSELSRINFNEYLRQLTVHLLQSYGISPHKCSLSVNIKDIYLGIDTAIPCGLLTNELITNSLKHAFPGDRKGEINIDMTSNPDNMCTLIVKDNGIGIPDEIDFKRSHTQGMQLIMTLAKQLEGEIEIDKEDGTKVTIVFPAGAYKPRI
jgi:PAS domain S-box-containing protein